MSDSSTEFFHTHKYHWSSDFIHKNVYDIFSLYRSSKEVTLYVKIKKLNFV